MCVRLLLTLCIAATLAASVSAAGDDNLSDFYNDLVTDLGPFLSLFGESMTKQYLSESTTWCDYLIFAMGPIGILTTVISVIRVCGYSWLKAFIGRSQEGVAVVEAELCTSTSRDVCELYNHGGIARILGRPKLVELIHIPPRHRCKSKGAVEELELFRNYIQTTAKDDPTHWKREEKLSMRSLFNSSRLSDPTEPAKQKPRRKREDNLEAGIDNSVSNEDPDKSNDHRNTKEPFCHLPPASLNPPNLSLNIGILQLNSWAFYTIAAVGLILQGGVVIMAAVDAWAVGWTFQSGSDQVNQDAPFLFVIGTVFMCGGTMACAALIGQTTQEIRYSHQEGSRSRLIYLQPHQVIGDQSIDPFAFLESEQKPLKVWTCSKKEENGFDSSRHFARQHEEGSKPKRSSRATKSSQPRGRRSTQWFQLLSLGSVAAVLIGYILQFTGLRRMKTWVSFAQLGITILMSLLRGILRMQRLADDDNLLRSRRSLAVGYELDWLAFEIWRNPPHEPNLDGDSDKGIISKVLRKVEGWRIGKPSAEVEPDHSEPSGEKEDCRPSCYNDLIDATSHRQLLSIRHRLANLTGHIPETGPVEKEEYQRWDDKYIKVRTKAKALSAAICTAANNLNIDRVPLLYDLHDLHLKIPNFIHRDLSSLRTLGTEDTEILLKKPDEASVTGWTMDAARLEAVLGLAMWTMVSDNRLVDLGEESAAETIEVARIISLDPENSREMSLWFGEVVSRSKCESLNLDVREKHGLFDLWQKPSGLSQKESTGKNQPKPSIDKLMGCELNPKDAIRFCGWDVVTEYLKEKTKNTVDGDNNFTDVQFVRTTGSLLDICAQELFTTLLVGLKNELQSSRLKNRLTIDEPVVDRSGRGIRFKSTVVTELVEVFVNADLGSAADALHCVVSALRGQFPTDKLELEILTGFFPDKSGWMLQQACEHGRGHIDGNSISPYLRTLGYALRFAQLIDDVNATWHRNKFQDLRKVWDESTSDYKIEITEILKIYADFLGKVSNGHQCHTSQNVTPYSEGMTDDFSRGNLETTLSYLAETVRSRRFERPGFSEEAFPLLDMAVRNGQVGILFILLNLGVNPTQTSKVKESLLYTCFEGGYELCARVLINHGVLKDMPEWSPQELLLAGMTSGHEDMINLMIDLRKVRHSHYMEIIKSVDVLDVEFNRSIFRRFIKRAVNGGTSPMKIVPPTDPRGWKRFKLVTRMFLSHDEVIIKHGKTQLYWAVSKGTECEFSTYGYEWIIQTLVEKGVQPDKPLGTPNGNTALHIAVERKWVLNTLINRDPTKELDPRALNFEVKNDAGQTPFCRAVCEGQLESATFLLEMKALVEPTSGQRPMDCAVHNNDEGMIRLLLKHGASFEPVTGTQKKVPERTSAEVERLLTLWKDGNISTSVPLLNYEHQTSRREVD